MSSQRLVSAVIVLKYATHISPDKAYLGRAAHKIAFGLIRQVSLTLADELHDLNQIMPLTVSDLFPTGKGFHWMRLTGLREDVVAALIELCQLKAVTYDGWRLEHGLTQLHDWSGMTTVDTLISACWQPDKHIHIQFKTPATIKSKGLYRPLPDAVLVFKSLYERWQSLIEQPLPYLPQRDVFETFVRYAVAIRDYDLHFQHVMMKSAPIQAFSGQVHYCVESPSRALKRAAKRDEPGTQQALTHYDDLTCLLNLLTGFGFYAGVGSKTPQGFGMMRRITP